MIQIAIVEDQELYTNEIERMLNCFSKENQISIQVKKYEDGWAFEEDFHSQFDLILMDIEMPRMDGLATAREIRKKDEQVVIIFITNMTQYALQGYEVKALDYLIKPVNYFDFSLKLKSALRKIRRQEEQALLYSKGTSMYKILLKNIMYIEVYGHRMIYHTTDEDIEIAGDKTLKELERELQGKGFCRCYKSYMVNLRFVQAITDVCVLNDGTELPISRDKKKLLMQQMMTYFRGSDI